MKKKWIASMLALVICMQVSAIPVKAEPLPDGVEYDNWGWSCEFILGDLDMSGKLDERDISILQSYLHKKTKLIANQVFLADYNFDGVVNIVDLCLMKRAVLENSVTYESYSFTSPDGLYKTIFNVKTYMSGKSMIDITWYDPDGDSEQVNEFSTADLNPFKDEANYHLNWGENVLTVEYKNSVADLDNDGFNVMKFDYPDRTPRLQTYSKEFGSKAYPEITQVDVTAECYNDIQRKVNVRTSGEIAFDVPSKVGEKVLIQTDESITNYRVTFHYNEDELRWVPENNLIIIGKRGGGVESQLDTENNTISFNASEDGTYVMMDAYEWYRSTGRTIAQNYAYEKGDFTQYISDWERAGKTGDIMNLVDKDWVSSCGKEFHVSNAEQLAGFVYYCNACDLTDGEKKSVKLILEDDVDLSGYTWAQIDEFYGEIDGNGHTISNMKVSGRYGGMISKGYYANIHDINIENAEISTDRGGIVMGYNAGTGICSFKNVHVSGNIKSTNSDCGAIVGYENGNGGEVVNCSADVTLNGEPLPFLTRGEYQIYHYLNDGVDDVKISIDNSIISREENENYDPEKMMLVVIYEGKKVVFSSGVKKDKTERNISDFKLNNSGTYQLFMVTAINGKYSRISNIVTYTVE